MLFYCQNVTKKPLFWPFSPLVVTGFENKILEQAFTSAF
jgi:hypothetical protein